MKQYKKPEIHFVNNTGGLSGDEIAKLSDEDLAKYLHACNYPLGPMRTWVSSCPTVRFTP